MKDQDLVVTMLKDTDKILEADTSGDEYIRSARQYVDTALLLLAAARRRDVGERQEAKDEPEECRYPVPTQVKFYLDGEWKGGIAYRDEIICGCCGGIQELSEFEDDEVVDYESWISISDEIIGGDDLND